MGCEFDVFLKILYVYVPGQRQKGRGGVSQSVFEHGIISGEPTHFSPRSQTFSYCFFSDRLALYKNHLQASESCFRTKRAVSQFIFLHSQENLVTC